MKKVILLIAVISFIGFSANAQSARFGLKAGVVGSNMKFSGNGVSLKMTTKIGFYAGGVAEIGVSDNFAVQPELDYSLMGAKSKGDGDFGDGKLDLSYISVPVLLKYKNQGFSAFLGPQIGVLMAAKAKGDGDNEDVKDQFKSTDFSGVLGVGYTLESGLGFDARYQMGFSDIAKQDQDLEGAKVKNEGFKIGIHYFFNK